MTSATARAGYGAAPMARSRVKLPPDVRSPFEVYLNGVRQQPGRDYRVESGKLVFDRELRKDHISKRRWFLGAWGGGTYRQDDTAAARNDRPEGAPRVAHALEIEAAV